MTLRFMDSFDTNSTATLGQKWLVTATSPTIVAPGRNGYCVRLSGDTNSALTKVMDNKATWIVGFALEATSLVDNRLLFVAYDTFPTYQCNVRLTSGGQIKICSGSGSTALAISTLTLSPNVWNFIEIKLVIADSGSCVIKVNDVEYLNATGIDTQATANSYANALGFGYGSEMYIDDLYFCDGDGADDFRGDCKVECIRPSGAGNYSQFTPLSGANYTNVDDAIASAPCPDGDTTYNESGVVGNIDTFVFEDLVTLSGTIEGIQTVINATKTDAGTRTIAPVVRQSSTDYVGTSSNLAVGYLSYVQIYETNPATSAAWTIADINTNAEFGYKDIA